MRLRRKRCYGITFIFMFIMSSTVCLPAKNHTSPRSASTPNDQSKDKDETLLGELFPHREKFNSVQDFVKFKSWLADV